ncbi:hypothetical protein UlMin_006524 [Ulmus minor]
MREFNEASKLADEVNGMISGRSSLPPSGQETVSHGYSSWKGHILRTKLETLQSLLETKQRQDMLTNLSHKAEEMATTLNMPSSANRDNLLGSDRKLDDIMNRANNLDDHSLISFQWQIRKVSSTKHIALVVNEELDLHNTLLDKLDEHVDSTDTYLKRVQKRLAVLNKRKKILLCLYRNGSFHSVFIILLLVLCQY